MLRELSIPLYLGAVLAEHAELLASVGRETDASALVVEARELFERLRATPWLERVDALRTAQEVEA